MRTGRSLIAISIVSLAIDAAVATAQGLPPSMFATDSPKLNTVVVEDEYQFVQRHYSPSAEVKIVRRDSAAYDSPEAAAIAGISAMASGDFDWFRSTWDEASRAALEARDREMKQDADFWKKTWNRAFTNRRAELTDRIETGDFVLIAYRLVPLAETAATAKPGEPGIELIIALRSDKGKWVATQQLAADPVLALWKTPNVRTKRVVRAAPPIK